MHQGSVAEAAQLAFKALRNPNLDSKEKSNRVPAVQFRGFTPKNSANVEVINGKTLKWHLYDIPGKCKKSSSDIGKEKVYLFTWTRQKPAAGFKYLL